eukprot:TRINITY_DN7727_c0_g2_i1.p1 TRINITY_DN7727_c0_g2~~TRINITY_DN7727_c0_g2_i1.p1  ORF type:complete len:455 (-),score=27.70 TRINITY_DN7727_c0_g2_i1:464-1783(-)
MEKCQRMNPLSGVTTYASATTYMCFMLFGAGSGWIVQNAITTEMTAYQERFGLNTANRISLGSDLGALCVFIWLVLKRVLSSQEVRLDYQLPISILACMNLVSLLIVSRGIASLDALMAVSVMAGSCGYLQQVIHAPYLIAHYHNVYAAAYLAGDACVSFLLSSYAIVQRPDLTVAEGRRFTTRVFYLSAVPLVIMAYAIFLYIHSRKLGRLEEQALNDTASEGLELSSLLDGSGAAKAAEEPTLCQAHASNNVLYALCRDWVGAVSSEGKLWKSLFYCSLRFFLSFTCWGVSDSLIPFACAKASVILNGDAAGCTFSSNIATNFALLIAPLCASFPSRPRRELLLLPAVIYVMSFLLLCSSVSKFGAHLFTADIVVAIVFVMRMMCNLMNALCTRLIQIDVAGQDREFVSTSVGTVAVVANLAGVFISSLILQSFVEP